MKRHTLLLGTLLVAAVPVAAQPDEDFDDFMKSELAEFDSFISKANKDFIDFMRNPWKQLEAHKPVVKISPKPVTPVLFDEKVTPIPARPEKLTIKQIIDKTIEQERQIPTTTVKDVDDIASDRPAVPKPIDTKPVETTPAPKPVDEPEPVAVPEKETPKAETPKKETPKAETPKADTPKPETPQKETPQVKVPEVKPPKADKPKAETPKADTPKVDVPKKETPKPETPKVKTSPLYTGGSDRTKVVYAGQQFYVSNQLEGQCRLTSVKENAIADAYESLFKVDYQPVLDDCNLIVRDLRLNEWGLFKVVEAVADAMCDSKNESVVLQQFMLNELGFKAKMARKASADEMILMVATNGAIYARPYITINGLNYYMINETKAGSFMVCPQDAPSAKKKLDMALKESPLFTGDRVKSTHTLKEKSISVSSTVPKRLIDFYSTMPQCDFDVYLHAPVDETLERDIISTLTPKIQGLSKKDAAGVLLSFVQEAFDYATDPEQFGYEKPFFVEELFYYPYCDCEDRSVLYSYLVRKLLGLDVVLLRYPNHIATAVNFDNEAIGDYVVISGKNFTVCDPTFIGAPIGMAMPSFKNVAPTVIKY